MAKTKKNKAPSQDRTASEEAWAEAINRELERQYDDLYRKMSASYFGVDKTGTISIAVICLLLILLGFLACYTF